MEKKSVAGGLIVFVCFLIAALEGYDIQAFGVAAPRMAPELGLDPSQLGWGGSAAMIGLVALAAAAILFALARTARPAD